MRDGPLDPQEGCAAEELVVLLDEAGAAIGVAAKASVHGTDTPRHLAFSCYVFDGDGRLLVTQRALDKTTFPGLVTNSVCGHPGPGESLTDAVCRRAREELGLDLAAAAGPGGLRLVLPDFAYRAEMDGIIEDEACPVFAAFVPDGIPMLADPHEVAQTWWMPWDRFRADVLRGQLQVSPWCRDQVRTLDALGPDPTAWPGGDPARLPAAASVGPG